MLGSGVLTCTVHIQIAVRLTQLARLQRPIISDVFAAVRGSTPIRTRSGALTGAGTAQITVATSTASALRQDRVRILFSGATVSGPLFGSDLSHWDYIDIGIFCAEFW